MLQNQKFIEMLRAAGFRATPGRIRLLSLLSAQRKPLTVAEIRTKLGRTLNEATLYRALEALAAKGILERTELGHGHAHYELAVGKRHHHHVICTDCSKVEDVDGCLADLQKQIRSMSKSFGSIYSHNLEFFGRCVNCTAEKG